MHPLLDHPDARLMVSRRARSLRSSSWDRSGANNDFVSIAAGETAVLLDREGPGCVTHLYAAMILPDLRDYRSLILRAFWDGASEPSVEVPLGDFFTLSHARVRELSSYFVSVNPGFGSSHGLNAYFPMPFDSRALLTVENRGPANLFALWFHVEYEVYEEPLPDGVHRFHASYRHERPTTAIGDEPNVTLHQAPNLDGAENYVALDTAGEGRMVGLHLQIQNVQDTKWYGEGDDMVFVDGDRWPPSIHGTGTEEIFGGGACPSSEYAGLYSGFHLIDSPSYDGLVGAYRWYVHDPIHFSEALRWTVEHGHANNFANNYSSVAYWYQTPLAKLPPLPSNEELLPPLGEGYEDARREIISAAMKAMGEDQNRFYAICQAAAPFYRGEWNAAVEAVRALT